LELDVIIRKERETRKSQKQQVKYRGAKRGGRRRINHERQEHAKQSKARIFGGRGAIADLCCVELGESLGSCTEHEAGHSKMFW
jgi:hypothetical protein